jgi:hypothetical protein
MKSFTTAVTLLCWFVYLPLHKEGNSFNASLGARMRNQVHIARETGVDSVAKPIDTYK